MQYSDTCHAPLFDKEYINAKHLTLLKSVESCNHLVIC